MRLGHQFALAVVVLGLTSAAAQAAPPFPHSYRGTITGSFAAHDGFQGTTTNASWTIKGVALRLVHVHKSDADWGATYAVTAGKITYHEAETGKCSYVLDTTLPLKTSLSKTSSPFALSQSLFFNHATHALGLMNVKRSFKVSETCQPQQEGDQPQTESKTIQLPPLFDPGEKRVTLGRRFAAKNGYRDSHEDSSSTTKWSWVLRPRR